jgi:hypothetical protein
MYDLYCKTPGDINEHLPTLKKYAEQSEVVTELGVRFGVSTWAFIEARPKKLICCDIHYTFFKPYEQAIKEKCLEYKIDFSFIPGDSLKIDIEQTDLLFLDTLHTYKQLHGELTRHADKTKKWIILHDTQTYGQEDESIYDHASDLVKNKTGIEKQGLINAIDDFLLVNKSWRIKETFTNNNGLTVLEKI